MLAFDVAVKALTAQPRTMRKNWTDPKLAPTHKGISYDQHTQTIADEMRRLIGPSLDEQQVLTALRSNATFVYLDHGRRPGRRGADHHRLPGDRRGGPARSASTRTARWPRT